MKEIIKKIIPKVILQYYWAFLNQRNKKTSKFKGKSIKTTFTEINKINYWNSQDSISGTGSDLIQTNEIIQELPKILKEYKIASMLDLPCGDFHWMQNVNLSGVNYIGGDIVLELIENNKLKYEKENYTFEVIDLTNDTLPKVDLVFCRDCLVHLSYSDLSKALYNIIKSNSKYLLTTSFLDQKINYDIVTGEWRPINLEKSPFKFPSPIFKLLENCTESGGIHSGKALLLWKISDIKMPELR